MQAKLSIAEDEIKDLNVKVEKAKQGIEVVPTRNEAIADSLRVFYFSPAHIKGGPEDGSKPKEVAIPSNFSDLVISEKQSLRAIELFLVESIDCRDPKGFLKVSSKNEEKFIPPLKLLLIEWD